MCYILFNFFVYFFICCEDNTKFLSEVQTQGTFVHDSFCVEYLDFWNSLMVIKVMNSTLLEMQVEKAKLVLE